MSKQSYLPSKQLLTLRQVIHFTGKGKTGIYEGMRCRPPTFPKPIKDGKRSRWLESEVVQWLADRIAERDRVRVSS